MNLSKSSELYRIILSNAGDKIPKSQIDTRDAELGLLKSCMEQSANETAKIPEMRQRMQMLDELDVIDTSDKYLDLSKSDIELIKKTFESFAGRRMPAWLRCNSLLDQLENPIKLADWLKRNQPQPENVEDLVNA